MCRTYLANRFSWPLLGLKALKIGLTCSLVILSISAQLGRAQSGTPPVPEANPGRRTVSTPATLTAVGYLQFENGVFFAQYSTEFSKRLGVSQVTKLSVLPRLQLFLQREPLAISQSKNQMAIHEGEVFVGMQGVLFAGTESWPTVSISYVRISHECCPGTGCWHFSTVHLDSPE